MSDRGRLVLNPTLQLTALVDISRRGKERRESISTTLAPFAGSSPHYWGPDNIGKTAILEALNLLLNPEIGTRGGVVVPRQIALSRIFLRLGWMLRIMPVASPGSLPAVTKLASGSWLLP